MNIFNENIKRVHFIGIGGIGISALARWCAARGMTVSGSDASPSEMTAALKKERMRIHIGHDGAHIDSRIDLVVHSAAIDPLNPELQRAATLGLPTLSYPQAVGQLTERYATLAVAGAHGKSTTSSLLASILLHAGFDPTVIIGTKLAALGGSNFRSGGGAHLVLEADEYRRAFLRYVPFGAIITNIDKEHLDCYEGIADIKRTFVKFVGNIAPGGLLIVNGNNPHLVRIKPQIEAIASAKHIDLVWYDASDASPLVADIRRVLRVPGMHMLSNALAAYQLATRLGVSHDVALDAIGMFRGSWRRMELRGEKELYGAPFHIYDDYAHHPTEIKATLAGFRERYPTERSFACFSPIRQSGWRHYFPNSRAPSGMPMRLSFWTHSKCAGVMPIRLSMHGHWPSKLQRHLLFRRSIAIMSASWIHWFD